jgi:hypothetical protein
MLESVYEINLNITESLLAAAARIKFFYQLLKRFP